MTTLLHIECSPRKQRSASLEIARQFIARYQQNALDTQVVTLDLWALDLPEFAGPVMDAKYAGIAGTPLSDEQSAAWTTLKALAAHLHQADVLVFSVPLWNFAIPYKLKHFIDVVSQKDVLFEFSPEHGVRGLLHNKIAVNVYARGMDFSAPGAQAMDFQKPYMEAWLGFIGVTDVHSLYVEKTILGAEVDQVSRLESAGLALKLADRLGSVWG
ncbi:FMN-dependent NADH-azoreductase [Pseudomonas salomonii]|uniref:FMN dependent NADH:quinone oxidoreductase n=1 Tax=Pseudomonas salomonii TaxID=191391 RepID=A0ABS9GV79_9PSED|nr:NAD(P)H-dependent oxidoreductase [Pseudomonas salomonii]MCF5548309.1 FMN-dependent NADH-azoreductase [Pseudomonas salomonii]